MNFHRFKKIASEVAKTVASNKSGATNTTINRVAKMADSLLNSKVENMDFANINVDKISYYTKAAFTDNPGELDFSLQEVFKLRACKEQAPDEFYKTAMNDKQFLLFGDTNHTDTDLHEFFYSKENRERLVEMGVKHVFLEVEPEYQDIISACAEGTLDADAFIEAMAKRKEEVNPEIAKQAKKMHNPIAEQQKDVVRSQVKALQYWHKNGVKVHCPDDRSNLKDALPIVYKSYEMLFNALSYAQERGAEKPIVNQRIIISYLFNSVVGDASSERKPKRPISMDNQELNPADFQNFMDKRMSDDVKLAQTISNLADGEASAILFGAGHGHRKNGLGDLIGADKVLRIDLHSKAEHFAEKGTMFQRESTKGYSQSDFVHILEDNKVYKTKGFKI